MLKTLKRSPQVTIFWIISFVATVLIWQMLPTSSAQIAIAILLMFTAFLTVTKHYQLPFMSSIFLALTITNYWQVNKTNGLMASLFIVLFAVVLLGLLKEQIGNNWTVPNVRQVSRWLLLGLITSEMFSFFSYWPVSFFNRSILLFTVFYFFYQMLEIYKKSEHNNKDLVIHFIFSGISVMLVIGVIIWINFPNLILF